jgi:16S rRNA pseudouridine516 synthase
MKCRLDKLLGAQGFGTRRDIKRQLKDLEFTRNGSIVTDPALIVDTELDVITYRGDPLRIREKVYLMLNKKAGLVSSTEDPEHETVIDALGSPWSSMDLFPVGRLDRDTEGLLLITNDGPLTHALTSPKRGVDKEYYVRLRDDLGAEGLQEYIDRAAPFPPALNGLEMR